MQDPVSELARRARELPPEDRERLVDELIASLPPEDRERVMDELSASFSEASVSEIDPAWDAEIDRRLAEIDQGKVELIDASVVFAEARRRFG